MTEENKKGKAIGDVLKEIQKKFSKTNPDIIFDPNKQYETVSSGNLVFDLITGIGGFPKGRITEIIAMESTGKTSLLLKAMGAAQKRGQVCVLFDFEQCFDPDYAFESYGLKLDMETFFLFQPLSLEEGDVIFEKLLESDLKIDLMGFDSIACMLPQAILDGSLEDNVQVGIHARLIGRFTHKLRREAYLNNFAAVYTNQVRYQIARDRFTQGPGISANDKYGQDKTAPGGMTPRFLASIRMIMELKGTEKEKQVNPVSGEEEEIIKTRRVQITNVKNKCARPELKGYTYFDAQLPGQKAGWNTGKDLLEILRNRGRITQNGATFKYIGLNIPEFTARGKAVGEEQFLNSPELLQDALALLDKLREEQTATTLLVEKAVLGVDFTAEDKKGQDVAPAGFEEEPEKTSSKKGRRGRPPKASENGDTTL